MKDKAKDTTQRRLRILGDDEIKAIYGTPHFTPEERTEYFSLSPVELAGFEQLHSIKSRIYYILQLGYFKARRMFFVFDLSQVSDDVEYIRQQYFPDFQIDNLSITKVTRLKQQSYILELCNYRRCEALQRHQLFSKAQQAAKICAKPVYIFRELIHYLTEQRIVVPGYSLMQDTIGLALTHEQKRLTDIFGDHLTPCDMEDLNRLLSDSPGLYEITQLKREPKDFSMGEIKREIHRARQIRSLYQRACLLLLHLSISNESIKYYASLVSYYSVYKLKRLPQLTAYVYLICFVYHRYQRFHDNLLGSLIHHIRRYTDEAKNAAKERVNELKIEIINDLQKAGVVLKLFTDETIPDSTPFVEVQTKAFSILERQKIENVCDQITRNIKFDETAIAWEHIDKLTHQFKRQLRPILLAVDFAASKAQAPLIEAVNFLKEVFGKGRSLSQYSEHQIPQQFIPDNTKRYLYGPDASGEKCFLKDRYEFLVYRQLRQSLEAGDIFCRDSVRFRSFDDDLVDDKTWQQKERLIEETGLTIFKQPIKDHLAALFTELEERIAKVNGRIGAGKNKHFEVKRRGPHVHWTLHSPRITDRVNHPFFDQLKQVDISTLMHFVNQRCQFMEAFDHILGRYVKTEADYRVITATLIAWATNMGIGRMGETSDIGYQHLKTTSDNFIRLETLSQANDRVSNAIAQLPIFRHYDIGEAIHSSSDGQKFETRIHTINARHSPKYFGLKKGIVSYTLVANHVPINAEIIGANDHESHYVFDILFNNTTDIQPEVHSTDTHGTNEVNFAILSLFGYQFAPRYRDFHEKVYEGLYGTKHPSQYDESWLIRPRRKINRNLIIEEWENIQRIIVSLALKTTTQSIIVSKLSAYARRNKTRRALWEYDNIIRSLYLLDYIDSVSLRQNVGRALNRGENYHQLRRAVSYANFGKLRFKTEYQQQVWNECARLLTNCIIYYNATILSEMLSYKEDAGDCRGAALIKLISPVAWQHLNFYGRYEFARLPQSIDLDAIIEALAQLPILASNPV